MPPCRHTPRPNNIRPSGDHASHSGDCAVCADILPLHALSSACCFLWIGHCGRTAGSRRILPTLLVGRFMAAWHGDRMHGHRFASLQRPVAHPGFRSRRAAPDRAHCCHSPARIASRSPSCPDAKRHTGDRSAVCGTHIELPALHACSSRR